MSGHLRVTTYKNNERNSKSREISIAINLKLILSFSFKFSISLVNVYLHINHCNKGKYCKSEIVLVVGTVNKRQHYIVISFLIGRDHTQNDPCN